MTAIQSVQVYMLWFNFILGLNFIFLCFKVIIIHYHTPKQRLKKFKPRIKLNYNIYINVSYTLYSLIYYNLLYYNYIIPSF